MPFDLCRTEFVNWMACMMHTKNSFFVTFESIADVVRGSHVTTGDRFCGADDNVGGFGNVLVTGRQTQANIFFVLFGCFLLISKCQQYKNVQWDLILKALFSGFYFRPIFEQISRRINRLSIDPNLFVVIFCFHLFIYYVMPSNIPFSWNTSSDNTTEKRTFISMMNNALN